MHSSRMRAARFSYHLGCVCVRRGAGDVYLGEFAQGRVCLGGSVCLGVSSKGCLSRGRLPRGVSAYEGVYPVNRMTDRQQHYLAPNFVAGGKYETRHSTCSLHL